MRSSVRSVAPPAAVFAIALVTALITATGCEAISMASGAVRGSGKVATASRELPPFTRIEILGSSDVEASVGGAQNVTVEADDNILPMITTEVHNGALVISSRGSFMSRSTVRVTLSVPALEGVSVTGSGDVRV
ncbi:MAG: GIN domain-containing protein, partial [Thermoplasmata archaeon]